MSFRFQDDWNRIVHLCVKYALLPEQIYFLLAWLENEHGPSYNVFNLIHSFNPVFTEQIIWAIEYIKKEEKKRLRYIKSNKLVELPEFIYYYGGEFGNGIKGTGRGSYKGLLSKLEEVRNELRSTGTFSVG